MTLIDEIAEAVAKHRTATGLDPRPTPIDTYMTPDERREAAAEKRAEARASAVSRRRIPRDKEWV